MASKQEKKKKEMEKKLNWKESLMLYLHDWIYLLMTIFIVFLILFRVIIVSGSSMYPTFLDGDYLLLLSKIFYSEPKQGDVVVLNRESFHEDQPIIKRIIATEGQTVDIDFVTGTVYVDGQALVEPYINNLTTNSEGMVFPLTVEENCIFVLGDNRQVSKDSRNPEIGLVDEREILGKAIFLYLPGTHYGSHPMDFDRIGAIE